MQQGRDQKKVDKASTGGVSSLDFNFLSDFESGADALEPPSAFMETNRNLPESGSP